ncbi:hypothetical protein IE81DRAFT_183760 [Ceraceosorus guamensis]|uniref:Translation initiation factor IF2/IF5 domain-containing protein n=1 Tax=Ceraceosorus guamensis TaxID=1522189 RepID=A0A316VUA6_9BASI|nr:hypothetical protein IE81DRAFT_183760 [Ceraceosorus guamensis]PWN41179.1 hypothetical protein IE81DRAFT_183760 [Ceraceosorus guamensis]
MFGGLKKKSKKKKAIPADLDFDAPAPSAEGAPPTETTTAADGAEGGDLDFGDMKKKPKKSKKAGFDLEAFEKELQDEGAKTGAAAADGADGAGADDEDLGDDPFKAEDGEEDVEAREVVETWHGTDRDYTYQELLGRVFSTLRAQNPALAGEKKKYSIVPPSVTRDGSKKTMFGNVVEICKRMHRQPEHVIQYLLSELGTEGSVDGSQRLIIKGRFQPKQIENVLRRYILEYVTCKTCKSPRTILKKENRIFFIACEACGSQRSVTTIRSGFQAQTGKRSKMRAQA